MKKKDEASDEAAALGRDDGHHHWAFSATGAKAGT